MNSVIVYFYLLGDGHVTRLADWVGLLNQQIVGIVARLLKLSESEVWMNETSR